LTETSSAKSTAPDKIASYRDVPIASISVGARLRKRNPVKVKMLAESIKSQGLLEPIGVIDNCDGTYELDFGDHRLAAVLALGWTTVPALVRPRVKTRLRRRQIKENFERYELTALDRAVNLLEMEASSYRTGRRDPRPQK